MYTIVEDPIMESVEVKRGIQTMNAMAVVPGAVDICPMKSFANSDQK
eukprot:CAMPEP_0195509852 /NCGR_PEP_ID=MMETSP0794_2-20130614/2667_1 /TAXON_ID=515487 /ORGANISM="Stephanopyxis turris, Strain CCMP 815" /LENGTH=46 /DNA_ID= /DNA_START= /DNA_END= /DNA_ORIENTATION=